MAVYDLTCTWQLEIIAVTFRKFRNHYHLSLGFRISLLVFPFFVVDLVFVRSPFSSPARCTFHLRPQLFSCQSLDVRLEISSDRASTQVFSVAKHHFHVFGLVLLASLLLNLPRSLLFLYYLQCQVPPSLQPLFLLWEANLDQPIE